MKINTKKTHTANQFTIGNETPNKLHFHKIKIELFNECNQQAIGEM